MWMNAACLSKIRKWKMNPLSFATILIEIWFLENSHEHTHWKYFLTDN